MKTMIIAGGSGFLGTALKTYFKQRDWRVFILSRSPKLEDEIFWDAQTSGKWVNHLESADALINLTGKSVDCRYTDRNRALIRNSRMDSTRVLHQVIETLQNPPKVWLNASSATTYVHAETQLMTESNGIIGDDFSMNICTEWEKTFFATNSKEIRKVALRTSIVLGRDGGAFPKLRRVVKLGLGGAHGNGTQKVSWIHIDDFCRAVSFILSNDSLSGPVNVTAPNPVSNSELMALLRKKYNVPFGMGQSVALLETGAALIGTETELLLKSRNVHPEKLLNAGFKFSCEQLTDGLDML